MSFCPETIYEKHYDLVCHIGMLARIAIVLLPNKILQAGLYLMSLFVFLVKFYILFQFFKVSEDKLKM